MCGAGLHRLNTSGSCDAPVRVQLRDNSKVTSSAIMHEIRHVYRKRVLSHEAMWLLVIPVCFQCR